MSVCLNKIKIKKPILRHNKKIIKKNEFSGNKKIGSIYSFLLNNIFND